MFWIALVVVGLLAVAAVAYVVAPLLQPGKPLRSEEDEALADLVQRKDETMRSIKEVEFDYHTGKLSQEDYERYDQRLRQQAIGLIRQIEVRSPDLVDLDQSLEKAIAAKRKVTAPAVAAPAVTNGGSPSSTPTSPASTEPPSATRFCHNCGAKVQPDDKFCAKCGTALRLERA